ncbi:MAG: tRNA (guanosine(37)-N1)-methyltransferase TrmD [endosymbiont of Galathealinum brachiosum]|uniref:tRNA (guanine-N(1)-)-methyltransferase n=1 Tax=endosymbiont of Galathealinum brachiosum TaxID=2200906 RepID=A0A370D8M3_9GAMM|nr:MAG: tRNA (guanosine(37)-N1)-methyltransferase TrmD [endosymbiont of Galathealinum brachiosum]
MRFDVVTLFPEMVESVADVGVLGRAVKNGQIQLNSWNPRDYTKDKHRTVDDRPYGGGPGMLMKVEPLKLAIEGAKKKAANSRVIYMSPQGRKVTQQDVVKFAEQPGLIIIAGRYEGIDERIIESHVDEEWSIGDYVLSGGELPALVLIDAIARMIPGVLGDENSAQQDSFMQGLLDCPHYTRPEEIDGRKVPQVLLSGNHRDIDRWRLQQSLGRSWLRRADLIDALNLTDEQKQLLEAFQQEHSNS